MDTEQYFYRNTIYSKSDSQISIVDIDNPDENRQELEPWFGIIFQLADGQHTIDELYNLLAQNYKGTPPKNLLETITSVLERMVEAKLIVLTNQQTELPYYLSMPYEMMDIEKARILHAEDRANIN